jgi:hypothetical protein
MRCSQASRLVASIVLPLVALGLASCGSSDPSVHGVSGAVAGLTPGESVRLELNGGNQITVSSLGTFTFPAAVGNDAAYSVTVAGQPQGQVCTVTNGTGAAITNNVTNVQVTCAAQTFTVSGTLTGLAADSRVVLKDNGADPLTLTTNGSFSFVTPVAFNGTYAVTVGTEPADATCTVQGGTGAGMTANVTSIAVVCSPITFTLRGTLNDLASGMQVTLENNATDPLTLSADGTFTFSTPIAESGAYNVTVGTQPAGQTCSVTNGQATQVTANVANITVTCSTNTYTIGGSVSGLGAGQQVTLEDNGGNALTVTANGSFTFTTPVAYGGAYTVTVGTQPTGGLICLVNNGAASSITADVTNVGISCVPNTVSFTTPGSYTWTVPDGLTSITVVATGGGGGGGGISGSSAGQPGGAGAVVTSTVSVTPDQVLNLVVGGGGGAGANGPFVGGPSYYFGAGGGGGGSSDVAAGSNQQVIAGGGGGGGSYAGGAGGNAGGTGGAGGNGGGASAFGSTGGGGGSGGIGGVAGSGCNGPSCLGGSNGNGGAGGAGGNNTNTSIPGGSGGSGAGAGAGASVQNLGIFNGGGGGGYGGGGGGGLSAGGGAGGSTGPGGTTYAPASNGGGSATNGGAGSIVITLP